MSKNSPRKPAPFINFPKGPGVYMIVDTLTKIKYVGSSENVYSRVKAHLSKNGGTIPLNCINIDDCVAVLLEDCEGLSKPERLQLEHNHIISQNTIWPNGLNKASPLTNLPFDIGNKAKQRRKKDKSIKYIGNYGKPAKSLYNVLSKYAD